jgi:hypothetical protein
MTGRCRAALLLGSPGWDELGQELLDALVDVVADGPYLFGGLARRVLQFPVEVYVVKGDADVLDKADDALCCAPAAEAGEKTAARSACC